MQVTNEPLRLLIEELFQKQRIRIIDAQPVPGAMNNNQLYRLLADDGRSFVAKFYFHDDRKRRQREYPFLSLLSKQGFTDIPHPIYESIALDCGVYEWIKGEKKKAEEYNQKDMLDLADFIARLHRLDTKALGKDIPEAYMAVLSMSNLLQNSNKRIEWIGEDLSKQSLDPRVTTFLEVYGSLTKAQEALQRITAEFGEHVFDYTFPSEHIRISSIDFGPHNTLFQADGKSIFIDFENAGLDHPLRTIIDVIHHQKTEKISKDLKRIFLDRYREQSGLSEEIWKWFEPMNRMAIIEWHLLHLTHLRPAKINQFKFSLANETFDEDAFIEQKLDLAKRTLEAMMRMNDWDIS